MDNSSFIWEERYCEQAASPHDGKGQTIEKWNSTRAIASFSLHTSAVDFTKFMLKAKQFPKMFEVNYQINEFWPGAWAGESKLRQQELHFGIREITVHFSRLLF